MVLHRRVSMDRNHVLLELTHSPRFRPEARRAAAVLPTPATALDRHPPPKWKAPTMGTSLSQAAPASHRITAEDRMERIGQLTTKQQTDALIWLAGYAPSVFDAVAEAVEPCAGDGSEDPAPYCAVCGSEVGIFL